MAYLRTNREGLFFHTLGGGNSLAFVVPSVGARMLSDENFSSDVAQRGDQGCALGAHPLSLEVECG